MCPCYNKEMVSETLDNIVMTRYSPQTKYSMLTERYLNFNGRTKGKEYTYPGKENAPNYKLLKPLVFTYGEQEGLGFVTMKDCLIN